MAICTLLDERKKIYIKEMIVFKFEQMKINRQYTLLYLARTKQSSDAVLITADIDYEYYKESLLIKFKRLIN